MTERDIRCLVSGVSLLHSEAALILLRQEQGVWTPIALPVWGTYEGLGSLTEIQSGPNAELIFSAAMDAFQSGQAAIDFSAIGQEVLEIVDIDTLFNLVACSQIGELDAVQWHSQSLGFALFSAHVVAALMGREPESLSRLNLEELPGIVLPSVASDAIYASLAESPLSVRLKFGLSFVAFASLEQELRSLGIEWSPTRESFPVSNSLPAAWLLQAAERFSEDPQVLEALEEHGRGGEDKQDELLDA